MLATATVAAHSVIEKCCSMASDTHHEVQNVQASKLSKCSRRTLGACFL